MEALLISTATLLGGLLLGYRFRLTEFRRDHRLEAYSDFIASFLESAHIGAGLVSQRIQLGEDMFKTEHRETVRPLWEMWTDSMTKFDASMARVRLVGSDTQRAAADELEEFLEQNVRRPLNPTVTFGDWGSVAGRGPKAMDVIADERARTFADQGRREVTRLR